MGADISASKPLRQPVRTYDLTIQASIVIYHILGHARPVMGFDSRVSAIPSSRFVDRQWRALGLRNLTVNKLGWKEFGAPEFGSWRGRFVLEGPPTLAEKGPVSFPTVNLPAVQ